MLIIELVSDFTLLVIKEYGKILVIHKAKQLVKEIRQSVQEGIVMIQGFVDYINVVFPELNTMYKESQAATNDHDRANMTEKKTARENEICRKWLRDMNTPTA